MTIQNDFSCFQTCLRADVSNFLCSTRKRDVCVKPSLIVFQHTQCALFDLMLIGCYRIWSNKLMYAVIYVNGVYQPKQIKVCAIVCRPFEILGEAAEN